MTDINEVMETLENRFDGKFNIVDIRATEFKTIKKHIEEQDSEVMEHLVTALDSGMRMLNHIKRYEDSIKLCSDSCRIKGDY